MWHSRGPPKSLKIFFFPFSILSDSHFRSLLSNVWSCRDVIEDLLLLQHTSDNGAMETAPSGASMNRFHHHPLHPWRPPTIRPIDKTFLLFPLKSDFLSLSLHVFFVLCSILHFALLLSPVPASSYFILTSTAFALAFSLSLLRPSSDLYLCFYFTFFCFLFRC